MDMRRRILLQWNKFRRFGLLAGWTALAFIILYTVFMPSGPILNELSFSKIVYDRNGHELRITLSEDEKYRVYAHINSMGSLLTDAILLKEDKYFYYHPGINAGSIWRAFYQTYIAGNRKIGGSTITMQVARMVYDLNTRSIWGKMRQMAAAIYLELYYSKNEIMQAYVNSVPCGGNIEGFAVAALIFFDKELTDLTLQETLFLCVLPQNPSAYHPKSGYVENKLIKARDRLYLKWIDKNPGYSDNSIYMDMPFETQYHIPFFAPHYSNALLQKYQYQHKIFGTLDLNLQKTITRITKRYVQRNKPKGISNASVLLVDSDNMQILSSLGSVNFFDDKISGQVNGTRSPRSPGSTLKPFIYALAMEQGLIHPMTMLKDTPTSFSSYTPDNYERDFRGPVKAWKALITSRNIPAVSLASKIQPDLYDFLKDLDVGHLKEKDHYGLSIVLGSAELTMEELVSLYGIIANNGFYRQLKETYQQDTSRSTQTGLSEEVCFLIRKILNRNPRPMTSPLISHSGNKIEVAYKTGTSIGFKDCWSIALFSHYIIAVWLGNFDGYGNPYFNGRYMATPLMFEIIDSILPELERGLKELPPVSVNTAKICDVSGQIAKPWCQRQVNTLFIPGKSPITKCQICREIYIDLKSGYRTLNSKGKDVGKKVYEFWPTDLLSLFRKAGIPRSLPPPFKPTENLDRLSTLGFPPEIVSPLEDTEYIIYGDDSRYTNLPLKAVFDADVREVYWFIDEKYIGKAPPEETQYWTLSPGVFQIAVVDDHGRSSHRKIQIELAAN